MFFLHRRAISAMLGVPSKPILQCILVITLHMKSVLQQKVFLRVIAFLAMCTETLDVQEDIFVIVKQAFFFLQCFEIVHYQCKFCTGIAILTRLEKYVLQCKNCNILAFFDCILEQFFFCALKL